MVYYVLTSTNVQRIRMIVIQMLLARILLVVSHVFVILAMLETVSHVPISMSVQPRLTTVIPRPPVQIPSEVSPAHVTQGTLAMV